MSDFRSADIVRSSPGRLDCLTGMRFLAALQVVLFHTLEWPSWSNGPSRTFIGSGGVAVSFFFILSGFILTYTYANPDKPAVSRRSFYSARFARVYPVYALGLLVSAPLFISEHLAAGKVLTMLVKAGASILLLQSFIPKLALVWNSPGWSLSDEAFFYILFPFIVPWVMRLGRRGTPIGLLAVWLVAISIPIVYLVMHPDSSNVIETWSRGTWIDFIRYNPIARLPEFVLGMVLGNFHFRQLPKGRGALGLAGLPEIAFAVIIVVLAFHSHGHYLLIHNGGLAPVIMVLILALSSGKGPLVRILASRVFVLLGEASYALYILHEPIAMIIKRTVGPDAPTWIGTWSYSLVITMLSIIVSLLVARFFEKPLRTRLRLVFNRSE